MKGILLVLALIAFLCAGVSWLKSHVREKKSVVPAMKMTSRVSPHQVEIPKPLKAN